jgi:hypothetical protein
LIAAFKPPTIEEFKLAVAAFATDTATSAGRL